MPFRVALLVAVVVALVVAPAFAATDVSCDPQGPDAAVRAFLESFAGGNLECARELVAPEARGTIETRYARILAVRCMRPEQIAISTSVALENVNARATVHALVTAEEWKRPPATARIARRAWRFELRHDGERWWIEEVVEREQELAELLAGMEPQQQKTVLAANRELLTPQLGEALCRRAVTLVNELRMAQASTLNAIAWTIADSTGDEPLLSTVLGVESVLRRHAGDARSCRTFAEEAVTLANRSGDPDAIVRANLRLIRAHRFQWQRVPDALLTDALALADEVEDLAPVALTATQAAWEYEERGMRREALAYSILAERLAEASGDVTARMSAHMNLGGAYHNKHDAVLSKRHYRRALALAKEAGFSQTAAELLVLLGATEPAEVWRRHVDEAISLLEPASSPELAVRLHLMRASVRGLQGDLDGAERDIGIARRHNDRAGAGSERIDAALGELRARQGRYAEQLTLTKVLSERVLDPFLFSARAHAYRAIGRPADAEAELRIAMRVVEERRPEISSDPRQLREYMDRVAGVYTHLVDLLVDCGRAEEALALHERYKGSVLRDVLVSGLMPDASKLNANERLRLQLLEERLTKLNREAGMRSAAHHAELLAVRVELEEVAARAYAAHPELGWHTGEVDMETFELPPQRGIVYVTYVSGEQRTNVLVARRDVAGRAIVRAHTIPLDAVNLRGRIRDYLRRLQARDFAIDGEASSLYDLLLRPIERDVFGHGGRICIIPDDELWRLPFHALKPDASSYVADRATIAYAPSITAAAAMQRHPPPKRPMRLLAIADPRHPRLASGPLPHAAYEVTSLRTIYGARRTRIALDDAATERLLRDARDYDVLHIAAHAIAETSTPMYSALLLEPADETEDGRLEAREIAALDLAGRLVVLSGCETAGGETGAAEGIVGIPWAVIAAGARAAVLTQWSVDSRAAAQTMVAFHRHHAAGAAPAAALREAQRRVARDPRYRHPLYWAPFIAVGLP